MLAFREHQRKLKNEGLLLWTGRENKSTDSQLNNTVNEVGIWSKRIFGIHEKSKVSVLSYSLFSSFLEIIRPEEKLGWHFKKSLIHNRSARKHTIQGIK